MTRPSRPALRETWIILGTWCLFCAIVIAYCARTYRAAAEIEEATVPSTVVGLPSWVFWGIGVPWVVATLFTILFAMRGIADVEQDHDHE